MYRVFTERLDHHRDEINRRLSKQLKSQLTTLRTIIQGRARSWHVSASSFVLYESYFIPLRARLSYWNQSLIAPDIGFPRVFYPSSTRPHQTRPVPCPHDTYLLAAGRLLLDSSLVSSSSIFLPVQGAVRVRATNPRYGVSSGRDKRCSLGHASPLCFETSSGLESVHTSTTPWF